MDIYRPLTLKLHAYGLHLLHDPNWTGMELYDRFKRFYRGREEPRWLFQKPLKEGFLYQLGLWLYEKYVLSDDYREDIEGEYLVWYCEDFVDFLVTHGVSFGNERVSRLRAVLESIGNLYEKDEDAYFRLLESYRNRRTILKLLEGLVAENRPTLEEVAPLYGSNYAERVFHDRELCEFIANLLVAVGFDGTVGDEEPTQWVERPHVPSWLSRAVTARERGACAMCGTSLTQQLTATPNVDHIVPISQGGCNDMVNFQLLCEKCNKSKQDNPTPVTGSIPKYLQRK